MSEEQFHAEFLRLCEIAEKRHTATFLYRSLGIGKATYYSWLAGKRRPFKLYRLIVLQQLHEIIKGPQ